MYVCTCVCDAGSLEVERERNMTAVIVGILVTVCVFVLAVLVFVKVMCTLLRRRRDVVAVNNTLAYELPNLNHQNGAAGQRNVSKGWMDDLPLGKVESACVCIPV